MIRDQGADRLAWLGGDVEVEPAEAKLRAEDHGQRGQHHRAGGGGHAARLRIPPLVDPERDAKGGPNPKPVQIRVNAADVAVFKKEGGLT